MHLPVIGDRWMLCSDGLTDYVRETDVHAVLAQGEAEAAAERAVARALEAGTRDNVTAVVCDVVAGDPLDDQPVFHGALALRFNERLESP